MPFFDSSKIKPITAIKTLTISRKKWQRGSPVSSLRVSDTGKMCPLGFLCRRMGFSEEEITDVNTLSGLAFVWANSIPRMQRLRQRFGWLLGKGMEIDVATRLMQANDSVRINDKQREKQIKEIFGEHGIQVKFVD